MTLSTKEKKYFAIINPISGIRKKYRIPAMLAEAFSGKNERIFFSFTKGKGDASLLVQQAIKNNVDAVIAVGGDGTINEIAGALYNSRIPLGIVPKGSGNGLARALGLPLDKEEEAIEIIKQGGTTAIDTAFANGIPFFCTFGVGFDAAVTQRYAQASTRGISSYIISAIEEYFSFRPKHYRITSEGKTIEREAMLVTCANIDQYGNNAFIAPHASPSDGKIDLIIAGNTTGIEVPQMALQLFTNNIDKNRKIESLRSDHIVIERDQPGVVQLDGESLKMGKQIEISISARSLEIYTPRTKTE